MVDRTQGRLPLGSEAQVPTGQGEDCHRQRLPHELLAPGLLRRGYTSGRRLRRLLTPLSVIRAGRLGEEGGAVDCRTVQRTGQIGGLLLLLLPFFARRVQETRSCKIDASAYLGFNLVRGQKEIIINQKRQ
jgi:hypothetical protein